MIYNGDVLETLRTLESNSFHGSLSDPPYNLGFMGKAWDKALPSVEVWKEVLRVLKPGAYLLAFGGTRTFHRLFCSIEDAGFRLVDTLSWLHGQGFPKGQDIGKAIDKSLGNEREVIGVKTYADGHIRRSTRPEMFGCVTQPTPRYITAPASPQAEQWNGYNTQLKPSWEPVCLAQKPVAGTYAANVLAFGCGGLNIDGCRVGNHGGTRKTNPPKNPTVSAYGNGLNGGGCSAIDKGRYPANLILDEQAGKLLETVAVFSIVQKQALKNVEKKIIIQR